MKRGLRITRSITGGEAGGGEAGAGGVGGGGAGKILSREQGGLSCSHLAIIECVPFCFSLSVGYHRNVGEHPGSQDGLD